MAKNYYVVLNGWRSGIYSSWYGSDGALAASSGHPGEQHQGFEYLDDAIAYYKQHHNGKVPCDRQWYKISPPDLAKQLDEIIFQPLENMNLMVHIRYPEEKTSSATHSSHRGLPIDTQDIGRWGEEFAYLYLITHYLANIANSNLENNEPYHDIVVIKDRQRRIHWRNQERESNKSPDILDQGLEENLFFEVKTTLGDRIDDFDLTPTEWDLAKEKGAQYIILRVTGAGTPQAKIYRLENPYQLWLDGQLTIPEVEPPPVISSKSPIQIIQGKSPQKKLPAIQASYFEGIGRRKAATARVRIYPGTTRAFEINGVDAAEMLTRIGDLERATKPLTILETTDNLRISAMVQGGGVNGWLEAIQLGLARALVMYQPELRKAFREAHLLTRDARIKERKKPGLKRARKAPTYTKR